LAISRKKTLALLFFAGSGEGNNRNYALIIGRRAIPSELKEIAMRKTLVTAAAAAIALCVAAPSFAQTVGVGVTVAPEERTRIKEYVVKERVAPVTFKERVRVGAKLPADVELRTAPADWGPSYSRYRYVYSDNNVYLVEPSSREIVHVID
jgi:hypothetical protein